MLAIEPKFVLSCPSRKVGLLRLAAAIRFQSLDHSTECRIQLCYCKVPCTCTEFLRIPRARRNLSQSLPGPRPDAYFRLTLRFPPICPMLANPRECQLQRGM